MPYWRCYFHVIWATKNREPLITPDIEKVIFQAAKEKSQTLASPIQAINTVEDHVHVAVCVCIAPKIAVAEWVRNIKGITAHAINDRFLNLPASFRWQQGYGVVTFGAKNLPWVMDYVDNQKIHHAQNTFQPFLEQMDN